MPIRREFPPRSLNAEALNEGRVDPQYTRVLIRLLAAHAMAEKLTALGYQRALATLDNPDLRPIVEKNFDEEKKHARLIYDALEGTRRQPAGRRPLDDHGAQGALVRRAQLLRRQSRRRARPADGVAEPRHHRPHHDRRKLQRLQLRAACARRRNNSRRGSRPRNLRVAAARRRGRTFRRPSRSTPRCADGSRAR